MKLDSYFSLYTKIKSKRRLKCKTWNTTLLGENTENTLQDIGIGIRFNNITNKSKITQMRLY